MKFRLITLGLLAFAATAHADVQVNFLNPDKFIDIKDNNGFRDESVLKDIEKHFVEQAQKYLPGKDVRIDVTDVDLAGNVDADPLKVTITIEEEHDRDHPDARPPREREDPAPVRPVDESGGGGCSCRVGQADEPAAAAFLLLTAAVSLTRRRRRA